MFLLNFFNKFFGIFLRKVLIIFFVGFIFRALINNFFGVNVFKEYLCYISILYYGGMASFSVIINDSPCISFNTFNIKCIGENIGNYFLSNNNFIYLGEKSNISYNHFDKNNVTNNMLSQSSNNSNKSVRKYSELELYKSGFKSAASRGLYNLESIKDPQITEQKESLFSRFKVKMS